MSRKIYLLGHNVCEGSKSSTSWFIQKRHRKQTETDNSFPISNTWTWWQWHSFWFEDLGEGAKMPNMQATQKWHYVWHLPLATASVAGGNATPYLPQNSVSRDNGLTVFMPPSQGDHEVAQRQREKEHMNQTWEWKTKQKRGKRTKRKDWRYKNVRTTSL